MTLSVEPFDKNITSPLLTVEETADKLKISKSAVYNLINQGDIEYVRVYGRTRRVLDESVDAYIELRRRAG
jgi:excisionase family DNA binding protein